MTGCRNSYALVRFPAWWFVVRPRSHQLNLGWLCWQGRLHLTMPPTTMPLLCLSVCTGEYDIVGSDEHEGFPFCIKRQCSQLRVCSKQSMKNYKLGFLSLTIKDNILLKLIITSRLYPNLIEYYSRGRPSLRNLGPQRCIFRQYSWPYVWGLAPSLMTFPASIQT